MQGLRYRARTVYPGALILRDVGKSSEKIFAGRGQIRMSRHEPPGPLNKQRRFFGIDSQAKQGVCYHEQLRGGIPHRLTTRHT